ncbi:MAG: hypothetical protein QMC09_11070, partial [Thauera sp.]
RWLHCADHQLAPMCRSVTIGSDPRLSACLRDCAARLVRDWEAYAVLGEAGDLSQDSRVLH